MIDDAIEHRTVIGADACGERLGIAGELGSTPIVITALVARLA
jgi:hypothetical protein